MENSGTQTLFGKSCIFWQNHDLFKNRIERHQFYLCDH